MIHQNTLVAKLMDILEQIAQNIQYPYQFSSERCLADHLTYFSLTQYIFPELQPQIIKILDTKLSPSNQLNHLFAFLSQELGVGLFSKIDGTEIIRFNLKHINQIVLILHEYSKIINQAFGRSKQIHSEARFQELSEEELQAGIHSARYKENEGDNSGKSSEDMPQKKFLADTRARTKQKKIQNRQRNKQFGYSREHDLRSNRKPGNSNPKRHQPTSQYKAPKSSYQPKNKKYSQSKQKEGKHYLNRQNEGKNLKNKQAASKGKREKSRPRQPREWEKNQNLHQTVANIILNEKTRFLEAENRDNRKNKLEQVEAAKKEFGGFLKTYIKQTRASKSREKKLAKRSQSATKKIHQGPPLDDFSEIGNFFQSFAYRFREKKASYIRRLSDIIRQQELDRYCYQNRIKRETKQYMEKQLSQQLEAANHQHKLRSDILKQNNFNRNNQITIAMKEDKKFAQEQKKKLRQAKKLELQKISHVLQADNQRVLMNFEEGSLLEQFILKFYKKV